MISRMESSFMNGEKRKASLLGNFFLESLKFPE
jgi:hypothetical protein